MRREDAVTKWSYYPDTSTEELEGTKNPSRHSWQRVIEIWNADFQNVGEK